MRKLWIGLFIAALIAAAAGPSYVAVEKLSGHVGFFDADGKLLKQVRVGRHPHEMAFSPDGRFLYVTDNGVIWMTETGPGENTVSIVDTRAQSRTGVIDLGKYRRPHGIDVDPSTGNLLVTTELPSALLLVDPRAKKVLRVYDVQGEAPHYVKVMPDGSWAFVSNTNTGTLAAVNLRTGDVRLIPVGSRPQGAAFSPDYSRLYVCNSGESSISIIDTAAKTKIGDIPTGEGPVRIAVTADGSTLVYALQTANAAGFADTKSMRQTKQLQLPGQPVSMTLSAKQDLAFSSIQAQDKICVISMSTRELERTIMAPSGSGPDPYLPLP
ncbi:MAG: YncE family protein [bacterium]